MTEITSPVQLYKMLKDWHTVSVHNTKNILEIPTDGSIKITMQDEANPELTSELIIDDINKDAFFAGVTAVLSLFEDLPFEFDEPVSNLVDETP